MQASLLRETRIRVLIFPSPGIILVVQKVQEGGSTSPPSWVRFPVNIFATFLASHMSANEGVLALPRSCLFRRLAIDNPNQRKQHSTFLIAR